MLPQTFLYRGLNIWKELDDAGLGHLQAPEFLQLMDRLGVKPDSLTNVPFRHGGVAFGCCIDWLQELWSPETDPVHQRFSSLPKIDFIFHCLMLYDDAGEGVLDKAALTVLVLDTELDMDVDTFFQVTNSSDTVESLAVLYFVYCKLVNQADGNGTEERQNKSINSSRKSCVFKWIKPLCELYASLGTGTAIVNHAAYTQLRSQLPFLPYSFAPQTTTLNDMLLSLMEYCISTDYSFYTYKTPQHSADGKRGGENGQTTKKNGKALPAQLIPRKHKVEVTVLTAEVEKTRDRGTGSTDMYVKLSNNTPLLEENTSDKQCTRGGNSNSNLSNVTIEPRATAEYRTGYCRRTSRPQWNQKFNFYFADVSTGLVSVRLFENCPPWGKTDKQVGHTVHINLSGLQQGVVQEVFADTTEGIVHLKFFSQTFGRPPSSLIGVYSASVLATNITKLDADLFRNIQLHLWCNEAAGYSRLGEGATEEGTHALYHPTTQNVSIFVNHFNHISRLVSTDIVSTSELEERQRKLHGWISVAEECAKRNNWSGVTAIVHALSALPVARLRKTWSGVRGIQDVFQWLEQQVSQLNNYEQLRTNCRLCNCHNTPVIPFIGVLLSDLDALYYEHEKLQQNNATNLIGEVMDICEEYKRYQAAMHQYQEGMVGTGSSAPNLASLINKHDAHKEERLLQLSLLLE